MEAVRNIDESLIQLGQENMNGKPQPSEDDDDPESVDGAGSDNARFVNEVKPAVIIDDGTKSAGPVLGKR